MPRTKYQDKEGEDAFYSGRPSEEKMNRAKKYLKDLLPVRDEFGEEKSLTRESLRRGMFNTRVHDLAVPGRKGFGGR